MSCDAQLFLFGVVYASFVIAFGLIVFRLIGSLYALVK